MFNLLRGLFGLGMVGVLGRLAYLRLNKLHYPDPLSYIIQPKSDITIERLPDGQYRVNTTDSLQVMQVYSGMSPDAIDRENPLPVTGAGTFKPLDAFNHQFFEVKLEDGRGILVAQREVKLEGGVNFRDIGGYPAKNGRTVQWGKIYRSGSLYELTERDWQQIDALGIKLMCDLRSNEEVEAEPDRVLDGVAYVHTPIQTETSTMDRMRSMFVDRRKLKNFMPMVYTRLIIDNHAMILGDTIRRLADEDNLPAVVHCSAGKDRTGVIVALVLLVLGVPDDYIIADYTLSNTYYASFYQIAEKALKPLAVTGFTADDVYPMLIADAAYMRQTIQYIREHYGSARKYLKTMAGVEDATLQRLESNLLI